MHCKLCPFEGPHPRAIGDHWKAAHPAEFKKRQKAKKARAAEEPTVEETVADPETDTILALVAAIEVDDGTGSGQPMHDLDARARILAFVASRVGVSMTVTA